MNKKLARTIIGALAFSDHSSTKIRELSGFGPDDWKTIFHWLDNSNLALYLLRKIQNENAGHVLPPAVLSRL